MIALQSIWRSVFGHSAFLCSGGTQRSPTPTHSATCSILRKIPETRTQGNLTGAALPSEASRHRRCTPPCVCLFIKSEDGPSDPRSASSRSTDGLFVFLLLRLGEFLFLGSFAGGLLLLFSGVLGFHKIFVVAGYWAPQEYLVLESKQRAVRQRVPGPTRDRRLDGVLAPWQLPPTPSHVPAAGSR